MRILELQPNLSATSVFNFPPLSKWLDIIVTMKIIQRN